jgi:TIR domain
MAEAARGALFVCYSHTDGAYRERFETYLRSPALEGIEIFSDIRIESGDRWQEKIHEALDRADAALVLVSQEVMVSPFIQQVELRALLESNVRRGLRMYLVPVSPTLYEGSPRKPQGLGIGAHFHHRT